MSKESALQMIPSANVSPEAPIVTPTPISEPSTGTLESTRFAQLAKKEQALQQQREAFKKEQETYQSERATFNEIKTKLEQFEAMKVKDPVAALKLAGFTEQDLYQFIEASKDNSTPEERAVKATQAEIKKFQDEQAKKIEDEQNKKNEQIINQFKQDISKTITSNAEKYEFCAYNGPGAEELIYNTVEQVLQDSGEVISLDEAAQMVEDYYEEQYKQMNNLKKVKPKEENKLVPVKEEPKANLARTLSSKTSASVASTVITKRETPSEKKARLINKLANFGKS